MGDHSLVCLAGVGVAGNNTAVAAQICLGFAFKIETQIRLASGLVRAVTLEARVREERADVATEIDGVGQRRGGGECGPSECGQECR